MIRRRHVAAPLESGQYLVLDDELNVAGTYANEAEAWGAVLQMDRPLYAAPDQQSAADVQMGDPFVIETLIIEGQPMRSGRIVDPNAAYWDETVGPWPFSWQFQDDMGHLGKVVVGRIDAFTRQAGGTVRVEGLMGTWPEAQMAQHLIETGSQHFTSFDGGKADIYEVPLGEPDEFGMYPDYEMHFASLELAGATGVQMPDVPDAIIRIARPDMTPPRPAPRQPMMAAAFPVAAPDEWFPERLNLDGPTPLTVTDEGRVYGHVALRKDAHGRTVCHVGLPGCQAAPTSRTGYADFLLGDYVTASGRHVPVGTITLGTGHAEQYARLADAVAHYDHTGTAAAYVTCGEDEWGTWVAGTVAPDMTPERLVTLRASKPSGDWRPKHGNLELCAVLAVNVPGFPTPRVALAASGVVASVTGLSAPHRNDPGQLDDMVASGVTPGAADFRLVFGAFDARIQTLEEHSLDGIVASLMARIDTEIVAPEAEHADGTLAQVLDRVHGRR